MTESHVPRTPTGVNTPPSYPPRAGDDAGPETTSTVQERAKDTAAQAAHSLGDIAHDARDKAGDVTDTATKQVKGLAGQARAELDTQAKSQQKRAADGLRSLSTELASMASSSQDPGYATDLVQHASNTTEQVAAWLDDRDPSSIVREVQDFARRRPGLFIALAAGAGLLVGRLARGMKDAPSSEHAPDARGHEQSPSPSNPGPSTSPGMAGAHSAGWSSEQSPLDCESAGQAPSTPELDTRRGEHDVERP